MVEFEVGDIVGCYSLRPWESIYRIEAIILNLEQPECSEAIVRRIANSTGFKKYSQQTQRYPLRYFHHKREYLEKKIKEYERKINHIKELLNNEDCR